MNIFLSLIIFCLIIWLVILQDKIVTLEKDVKRNKRLIKFNIEQGVLKKPEPKDPQISKENISVETQPTNVNEKEQPNDVEKIFFGNIFNIIGAIALIIGLTIFIKLVLPYFILTPVVKILLSTLFAAAMLIWGLKLNNNEKLKNYSEVIIGIGLATIFITLYCATSLYNLIPTSLATILALLFVASGFCIADRLKTALPMWLVLFAGYINPFFVCQNFSYQYLFTYFLLLNALSIGFVHKNFDKNYINYVNFGIMILTTIALYSPINLPAKIFFGIILALYVGLTYFYKKYNPEKFLPYLYLTLSALAVCIFFDASELTRIGLFALASVILGWFISKDAKYLKPWGLGYLAATGILTLLADDLNQGIVYPFANFKTLAYIITILATLFITKFNQEQLNKTELSILKYAAITLGFICLHENAVILKDYTNIEYIISLLWILYAGIITVCGIIKKHQILNYSGITFCILTILRIFTFDMTELSSIYKIGALLALGFVLLLISYLYAKYNKK